MGATYGNDQAVDRAAPMAELERRGMDLCILARSFDPPATGRWPRPDPPARREHLPYPVGDRLSGWRQRRTSVRRAVVR